MIIRFIKKAVFAIIFVVCGIFTFCALIPSETKPPAAISAKEKPNLPKPTTEILRQTEKLTTRTNDVLSSFKPLASNIQNLSKPASDYKAPSFIQKPAIHNKVVKPKSSARCACGTYVCTGPRGGRYCITSGGAKRYGV